MLNAIFDRLKEYRLQRTGLKIIFESHVVGQVEDNVPAEFVWRAEEEKDLLNENNWIILNQNLGINVKNYK